MQPPSDLLRLNHWVSYRAVPGQNGKTDKIPVSPRMGVNASSTDPATWGSYQMAVDRAEADALAGVGIVFTGSGFTGIDLDHCVGADGTIEPWALVVVQRLNSYTEISPSGTGIHILVRAILPPGRRRRDKIEMYDTGRFFTFTGNHVEGTPTEIFDRQSEIEALHAEMFPPAATTPTQPAAADRTDADVIMAIAQSENSAAISNLMAGIWTGYKSQSEADLALCSHLAFFTGNNRPQMDRLFRASGLYRPKWNRGTPPYGDRTLQQAINTVHNTYAGTSGNGHGGSAANTHQGWQFFTLEDAYQPRAPAVHIVDGMLELPSLNIVYGPPGCLKSFLLADLMCCVAGGVPWLAPLPNTTKPAARAVMPTACVWVDMDNGARRTHERFEAIGRTYGLPTNTPLHYVSMPNPWLDASAAPVFAMMTREFTRLGARLVIVDNLGATLGKLDENSAEMAAVMSTFRKLAEDIDAAVVLVHHQRKSYGGKQRQGDSLRGHSSIEAAIDLGLLVEREPYDDDITVKATKCRGADVAPFAARFTYQNKGNTKELEAARFWGIETALDPNSPIAIQQAVMDVLRARGRCNQTVLRDETLVLLGPDAPGKERIRQTIISMAGAGQIQEGAGIRTTKEYWL